MSKPARRHTPSAIAFLLVLGLPVFITCALADSPRTQSHPHNLSLRENPDGTFTINREDLALLLGLVQELGVDNERLSLKNIELWDAAKSGKLCLPPPPHMSES